MREEMGQLNTTVGSLLIHVSFVDTATARKAEGRVHVHFGGVI